MELPFFQISTLEQVPYEAEKSIVMEFFTQYLHKHVMVDRVEVLGDIPFYEPSRSRPIRLDFP